MVTHIVFWRLKPEAEGRTNEENALLIKERLEALVGVIPGLLEMAVGRNVNGGEYDLALVSKFASMEALEGYAVHPEHQKISAFVQKVRDARVAVDF